jgi:hypothetical protein
MSSQPLAPSLDSLELDVSYIVRHETYPGSDRVVQDYREQLRDLVERGVIQEDAYARLDGQLASSKHLKALAS